MVEFSQAPVNEAKFSICVINHYVVWFDVTMHDALRVAVVKCLKDFKHVVSDIVVSEALVQLTEIGITCVNKLGDDRGSFSKGIPYNVYQLYNIYSFLKCLQNFNFSANLILLDYGQAKLE